MEEFVVSSDTHRDQSGMVMLKRKRSQRQRPLSPLDMVTTTSSSSDGGGGIDIISDEITCESTVTTTEEEEDLANCLILLAQSGDNNCDGLILENHRHKSIDDGNFTNGFYRYECRTCNKTFNSFQALGGHRASHKKTKIVLSEDKETIDHHQQHVQNQKLSQNQSQNDIRKTKAINNTTTNVTRSLLHGTNLFNKSHECSICGSEFSSGQALGGHMRRHRRLTTSQIITGGKTEDADKKQQNIPSFDLNLPAPDDGDDDDRNKFMFHGFPPPTLIDCHY